MSLSQTTSASKFLSLVLRHEPSAAHVTLDSAGWVEVEVLLAGCAKAGRGLTRDELEHVVVTNAKKRFEFSADGLRIRASQGHSIEVELEYAPQVPPELLYHGTATRFIDSIRAQGLLKMERHHVHLSTDTKTARDVGTRHGRSLLLVIEAGQMHREGQVFYRSSNGVWLTEHVPSSFIRFPELRTIRTNAPQEPGKAQES